MTNYEIICMLMTFNKKERFLYDKQIVCYKYSRVIAIKSDEI